VAVGGQGPQWLLLVLVYSAAMSELTHHNRKLKQVSPEHLAMTSAWTFWSSLNDLCAEMLNDAKCATIP
jgi:hypothetical protein